MVALLVIVKSNPEIDSATLIFWLRAVADRFEIIIPGETFKSVMWRSKCCKRSFDRSIREV